MYVGRGQGGGWLKEEKLSKILKDVYRWWLAQNEAGAMYTGSDQKPCQSFSMIGLWF